jgi:hypothetical protein
VAFAGPFTATKRSRLSSFVDLSEGGFMGREVRFEGLGGGQNL